MERECQGFATELLESIKRDRKFSDFVLKVGRQLIPVHRNVLSRASPYFEAMLSSDTIESQRSWTEILYLDPNAVKTCIGFIYFGKAKLSLENFELLIQASDLMQIPQLKEMYFEFLAENVTIETCHCYLDLALTYDAKAFAKIFQDSVLKNINKILNSEYICKRNEDQFRKALNLLPVNLSNREICKWRAMETWVKADVENRIKKLPDLFKVLLLDEIPLDCLAQDILVSDLVKNSDECKDAILASLAAVKQRPQTEPLPPYTKKPTHVVALNRESSMLHVMNLTAYNWSRYVRIPFSFRNIDMISIRGEVYLQNTGGDLMRYSGGKWETVCVLNKQLPNWLAYNDCIWFIEQSCIRKYNPVTNIWTIIPAKLDDCLIGVRGYKTTYAISEDCITLISGISAGSLHCAAKEFYFASQ